MKMKFFSLSAAESGIFELGVNLSESERGAHTELHHLTWLRPLEHL